MNFALCHPSRGRARQAYQTFVKWMAASTMTDKYQYILSLDADDPQLPDYREAFKDSGVDIIVNANRCMVEASNKAAEAAFVVSDVYILVSDDFACPKGWNEAIGNRMREEPTLLHVSDTIREDIVTLTIMNRAMYLELGYLYYPGYFSMWADNDLTETAKAMGSYVPAFDLVFPHNHWLNGKAKKDATYEREDSKEAWEIGKRLYAQRQAAGFPVKQSAA